MLYAAYGLYGMAIINKNVMLTIYRSHVAIQGLEFWLKFTTFPTLFLAQSNI